ncbi:MAG: NAD(P)H-dependent oxidoreductase [Bacillota bacterium]|nr:NAD(P)H-dependent oxidoreductase [Bacillota bacterium]
MKVLGLVGSARRLGNTEILVKEALAGARGAGADVAMVRLPDLRILPCDGCMSCVFSRRPCRLDDDVPWLFERMLDADGLVVGAPTYVLGPAGVIKLVLDRYLMVGHQVEELGRRGRRGAAISVAGLRGWNPFGAGPLSLLLLAMQAPPVGWLHAYAPGPGEVLLEEGMAERAHLLGRLVATGPEPPPMGSRRTPGGAPAASGYPGGSAGAARAGSACSEGWAGCRGPRPPLTEEGVFACPFCGSLVLRVGRGEVECPVCSSRAQLDAAGVGEFRAPGPQGHRWDPVPAREHIEGWVMSTRDRYLARRDAIRPLRERYRQMEDWWISPPAPPSGRA